jgi:hypothetical protein
MVLGPRVRHTSLLSLARLVLQFAVKYLAPAEMKVAAVCLSIYPPGPSHICDSIVPAAAYFPTRLLHGEQNDNRQCGGNCSRHASLCALT